VKQVVLVMDQPSLHELESEWGETPEKLGVHKVVEGGAERWLSSRNGCLATDPECEVIFVHDAARALLETETVSEVIDTARESGSALAAEPLADTLKRMGPEHRVVETVARESMWRAQTPQAAKRKLMLAAFQSWPEDGAPPTDEAMLLEAAGHHPVLVHSPSSNFKITTESDLDLARNILSNRTTPANS
jgi:2-C-methyl-D-erythritol 4-phosphate cytidylyltransferase